MNPYEPEVDRFTRDVEIHPINDAPEPKRRFMPSKWEEKKCGANSPGSNAMHLYLARFGSCPVRLCKRNSLIRRTHGYLVLRACSR